jgi:prepilin-type N-terminal cleavage/methylation domain-containing protein
MLNRHGFTLFEIIVVLIIIGIYVALSFPNYTVPTEQARAATARNNLLAIYSAEKNYLNNNGSYCLNTASTASASCAASTGDNTCADSLPSINCNLSLNTQDDGTYTYSCSGNTCTAVRISTPSTNVVLTLNAPIQLNGNVNPQCATVNNYCPP